MATQVQFRRGTTSQNNAFTGAIAEITYDTEAKTLRLHDGSTAGGGAVVAILAGTQTFTNKTLSTNCAWQGNAVGLAYGGTNSNITAAAGAVVYSTSSALAVSAAGTSGQVLTSGGTSAPTWVAQSSLTVGNATVAARATNIDGGSPGYLVYQVDTNDTDFIAPGASGYVLRSTGASTAPDWVSPTLTIGSTGMELGSTYTSIAGLNILAATGTSHWTLPVGTTAQRPGSPATGMIRYNSDLSTFEGYAASAWGSLGGVKSVDGYTYILAETSAGAGNGDLDFYAENSGGDGATQVGQWNRTNLKDYTGTIVGTQTTQNVFDTTATTINFGGAATTIDIGAGTGTTAIKNNATVAGTLGVTGATTLTGLLNANGGIAVDTNAFTVADTTGNTAIGGTLGVTGATTLSSTLDVTGAVNLNNTTDSTSATTGALIVDGGVGIAKNLHVGVNAEIDGNLVVDGNLTINGTTTTINATNLAIEDNLIYLNDGSTITNPDLGWVGNYNDGTYAHAGIFRDATDGGTFKVFKGYVPEPGSAIDTTHASFDLADLDVGGFYASDNASIGGTLGVTGATTLSSTLAVTGNSTFTGTINRAPTITLAGDLSGSVTLTDLQNGTLTATIVANSVALGTDTTGNYVASLVAGTGVTLANNTGEGATPTISIGQEVATNSSVTFSSVTAGTFTETSDERLKSEIIPLTNAMDIVNSLHGKAFIKDGKSRIGLIAQQVEQILPQVVDTAEDEMGTKSVSYGNIVAVLIEALKEQQQQIDELKAKLGN